MKALDHETGMIVDREDFPLAALADFLAEGIARPLLIAYLVAVHQLRRPPKAAGSRQYRTE